jgi:CheY-like chemotaxis protein
VENLSGKAIDVLLVEDNPSDVRLTEETLKESKVKINLSVVIDGQEATDFLHKNGRFTDAPRPDVILLDLNLPKKDGREVLKEIKEDPKLKCIPIVIITSSKAEEDVVKTYNLHANCYITKPINLEQFSKIVRAIEEFWFTIVKLPPKV